MKDPFYAGILFAIESKIHEGDRLAASRSIRLTDSNIRSLLIKAARAAQGRRPQPVSESAGDKDKFLAEFLDQLLAVRNSVSVEESSSDGTRERQDLRASDWIASLGAVKESCSLRTGSETGSRDYLDFLAGFLAQTGVGND